MNRRLSIYLVFALWLAAAAAVGISGYYYQISPAGVALTVWSLTGLLVLAYWFVPAFRIWVQTEPLNVFLRFHLTRLVGIWFLILYQQGRLPYLFAVPGGWGDIIAAVTAFLLALFWVRLRDRVEWSLVLVWNVFGLADILFVVVTAFRLGTAQRDSMVALTEFPLNLLPLFVVPVIIATHIFIFARLSRKP